MNTKKKEASTEEAASVAATAEVDVAALTKQLESLKNSAASYEKKISALEKELAETKAKTVTGTVISQQQKDVLRELLPVVMRLYGQSNNVLMRRDLKAWVATLQPLAD